MSHPLERLFSLRSSTQKHLVFSNECHVEDVSKERLRELKELCTSGTVFEQA